MRRPLPFALLVGLGLGLDQVTKWLVSQRLPLHETWALVPGVLHFTPEQNPGVAWSLLREHPGWILVFSLGVGVGIAVWYACAWDAARPLLLWAQGLLLVGAFGNLVDRVWFGYVRDFLDFRPNLPLVGHWPVFNVADACLSAGVALILLMELWPPARARRAPETPSSAAAPRKPEA